MPDTLLLHNWGAGQAGIINTIAIKGLDWRYKERHHKIFVHKGFIANSKIKKNTHKNNQQVRAHKKFR